MAGGEGTVWCPSQGDAGRRGLFLRVLFTVRLSTRLYEVQREDGVDSGLHGGVGGLVLLALREGQLDGLCGFFFSPSLPLSTRVLSVWLCPTQLRGGGGW